MVLSRLRSRQALGLLFATALSCPAFAEELAIATNAPPPETGADPIADLEAADAMPPPGYVPGEREELGIGLSPLAPEGASVLPIGVVAVEGEFERGAVVACVDLEGREIARGLVNYPSSEARRIVRHSSRDIEDILGYVDEAELIHRDNLFAR